jgi:putative transposase
VVADSEDRNSNLFWFLTQARVVISDWKDEYNHHRRQSALAYPHPGRLR